MSKFHINDKGEPGKCRADQGKCPFGGQSKHYNTAADARKDYEARMKAKEMATKSSSVALSSLVNTADFAKAIQMDLISERSHPDDPNLRVYSYTKKVQYGGIWTPETLLARGLILELPEGDLSKAIIRGRGLPKFFTVEQMDSDWSKVKLVDDDEGVTVSESPEISWDSPAVVSDKLNGALGLAYVAPDGSLSISTKGSFGSLEADVGTEIIRKLTPEQQEEFATVALNGSTALFEIITPKRLHPVSYGNSEELVLLGCINNTTGEWSPTEAKDPVAEKFGFRSSERLNYPSLSEAVRAPYRLNTEGFVVTVAGIKGQELYKVKPPEYHALRKFFYASTPKELAATFSNLSGPELAAISSEKDIEFSQELTSAIDSSSPLLAERRKLAYSDLILPVQTMAKSAESKIQEILRKIGQNPERRVLAEAISKEPQENKGLLFKAFSDVENGTHSVYDAARTAVFKNLSN